MSTKTPDARHPNTQLETALQRIYGLHRKSMDFRLDSGPYRDLLTKLDNPHNRLPPTIHVAGTNGKGSTIAMMRALAESRGLSVHVYTSPHLFKFNERIRVAGHLISDEVLLNNINYINTVNNDVPLTFFEFTSALMFHIFANSPADLCLIETGMGGRLDCTNVMDHPNVTVITSLGYDHQAFLGNNIEQIAFEKAGIMKANAPCVIAPQRYPEAMKVFIHRTDELNVQILKAKPDLSLFTGHLKGDHQKDNAATALLAIQQLYPDMVWQENLNIQWPGRFQKLNHNAIDFIYDGAHNEDSLKVLMDTLTTEFPGRNISLGLIMQDGKDPSVLKKHLQNQHISIYTIDMPVGSHPQTADALARKLENININVSGQFLCPQSFIDHIETHNKDDVLVIAGSLYAAQLIPAQYWPTIEM